MSKPQSLFAGVIGTRVFRVWRGYRSVFFLECGREVNKRKGAYTVGFDYCPWRILQGGRELVSGNSSLVDIDIQIQKLMDATIIDIHLLPEKDRTILRLGSDIEIETAHERPGNQWYLLSPSQEIVVGEHCQATVSPFLS